MSQNANDREDHASEIAVGIADEYSRRIPIVPPQGQGDANEWKQHV